MTINDMSLKDVFKAHALAYPRMRPRDYVKLAYQHALGCEHMIGDANEALARVTAEHLSRGVAFESIGGGLARVHLGGGDAVLSPKTVTGMFIHTANAFRPREGALDKALNILGDLAGELPVSPDEIEAYLSEYRRAGCPPVSHSEEYRAAYSPAYRVVLGEYARYAPLIQSLEALARERPGCIVAIDGMCASGKTTLAELLKGALGASVFHMDDFFLPPRMRTRARLSETGGNVHRERFLKEVLAPLKAGREFAYRPFDCRTSSLARPVTARALDINIVEGAYSCHPELIDYYDLIVVMLIDPREQTRRILERNGAEMLARFQNTWIPMENAYLDHFNIAQRADFLYGE